MIYDINYKNDLLSNYFAVICCVYLYDLLVLCPNEELYPSDPVRQNDFADCGEIT